MYQMRLTHAYQLILCFTSISECRHVWTCIAKQCCAVSLKNRYRQFLGFCKIVYYVDLDMRFITSFCVDLVEEDWVFALRTIRASFGVHFYGFQNDMSIEEETQKSLSLSSTGGVLHGIWVADYTLTSSDRRLKQDVSPLLTDLLSVCDFRSDFAWFTYFVFLARDGGIGTLISSLSIFPAVVERFSSSTNQLSQLWDVVTKFCEDFDECAK